MFNMKYLHIMLNGSEFREKHALLWAQWSYVIVLYAFRPIWTKFGMGGIHQNLFHNYEFRKNRPNEGHNLPEGVINELLSYFPHLLHDLVTNQCKTYTLFSICEFRENRP
jgi:hypothetical protein